MTVPGVYPDRTHAGIPDFATDFGFTLEQTYSLFDCDPGSEFNSAMAMKVRIHARNSRGILGSRHAMKVKRRSFQMSHLNLSLTAASVRK